MGNDQYFFKVPADGLDGFYEVVESFGVLGAKALVDDQGSQARARAPSEEFGQGNADGKVNAKRFATRIEFVAAFAEFVADFNVEGFARAPGFEVAQRFQGDLRAVVRQAREDAVGFFFDFWYGLFDDEGLNAIFAKRGGQFAVDADVALAGFDFFLDGALFCAEGIAVFDLGLQGGILLEQIVAV